MPYFEELELERENHIDINAVDLIANYKVCPNLDELLENKSERLKTANHRMVTGEELPLVCANTRFSIEYLENNGTGIYIQLYLRCNKILHIRCNRIFHFESNMWRFRDCVDEFYIIKSLSEFLEVFINGFKIVCKDVEFIKLEEYSGEEPLRNIYLL